VSNSAILITNKAILLPCGQFQRTTEHFLPYSATFVSGDGTLMLFEQI
jgi:hypothetical protein